MIDINALRQELQSFQCLYDGENEDHDAMLKLLDSSAPFHRRQFEPGHFTASAFVLHPSNDSILLIFHEKLRLWLQPGGHVDPASIHFASQPD